MTPQEIQKKIPYKDVFLTFKHYKEPLKEVPKSQGFGYMGCLLGTEDGEKVQCHICGKLFEELGAHTRQAHHISANEYREKFDLTYQTALISEKCRQDRKMRTMRWFNALSPSAKKAFAKERMRRMKEAWKDRKNFQPKIRLETKNKRGTCPDQLLDKIKKVKEELGYTPSLAEFIHATDGQRYKHLIYATFGSWKNALKMIGLQPKVQKRAGFRKYTNEELLEYLNIYAQENRKIPTATDCKRGLLPDYYVFLRRFGSMENARKEAGVYDFVDEIK